MSKDEIGTINNKLDKILDAVGELKITVAEHSTVLKGHTAVLKGHTAILKEHTAVLKVHSVTIESLVGQVNRMNNAVTGVEKEVRGLSAKFAQFAMDLESVKCEIHPIRVYYDTMMISVDGFVKQLIRMQDEQAAFRGTANRLMEESNDRDRRMRRLETRLEPA